MKKCVLVVFGMVLFGLSAKAQVVQPADVQISMGLIPVYELSSQAGCPYLLAAPSPQYYDLAYKRCPSDQPVVISQWQDKYRINEFMREICDRNIAEMNGCQVELLVNFPAGYNIPHFPNQDEE